MVDEAVVRTIAPAVLVALVARGADFASAEDAVQEALLRAHQSWPREPPRDAKGWLVTVAWRCHLDAVRSEGARWEREQRVQREPERGPAEARDTMLRLYFLCAHPDLSPTSAVALTLRALGGLSTRQIAQAFVVPEATMAQRISRAKATLAGAPFDAPGDLACVARVLYLMFNEGYGGEVDLAEEAIRLARELAGLSEEAEIAGLLALLLLTHARRGARTRADDSLVALAEQDRSLWRTDLIEQGVGILQRALARDRLGQYQAQAAIAALHADAPSTDQTDWVQICQWYDELVNLTDSPVHRLNRAVAVGEADGPAAGLAALDEIDPGLPRYAAVSAHLHERAGDLRAAAALYRQAAAAASRVAERDHLILQAARVRQHLTGTGGGT